MLKAVVFDLDGTLLDTIPDIAAALNHSLAANGLPTHPAKAVEGFVGGGIRSAVVKAAPAGCSLERPLPQEDAVFPVGTSGWSLSSGYGWRADPFAENSAADTEDFHRGVDLACAEGTPVLAAMDGVVLAAGRSASYGNYIRLCHADGVETLYAHLQYLFVRPGEVVRAGQVMGTAGQTGRATGPHLHFELLDRAVRCDPSALLGLPA